MSDRLLLISADGHAGAPATSYRNYLDPEFREAFDQYQAQMRAMTEERFGQASESRQKFVEEWIDETTDGGEQGAHDSDTRQKELESEGIVAEVLFPDADASGLGWSKVSSAPFGSGLGSSGDSDPALVFAGAKAHNRWMAEFVQEAPDRRIGLAIVPVIHDVERSLEEIKWAKEVGLGGILIPTAWRNQPSYYDHVYDPIWALCSELELGVHTHSGTTSADMGLMPPMEISFAEGWFWAGRPLWVMILGGVFERFPDLHFAITENLSFWVADFRRRMDENWQGSYALRKFGEIKTTAELPSFYLDRNCWIGSQLSKTCVARREETGINDLMFGSDFPHPEGTWPHTHDWMRYRLDGVPEDEFRKIVGLNALDMYPAFDRAKLEAEAERVQAPTYDDIMNREIQAHVVEM